MFLSTLAFLGHSDIASNHLVIKYKCIFGSVKQLASPNKADVIREVLRSH